MKKSIILLTTLLFLTGCKIKTQPKDEYQITKIRLYDSNGEISSETFEYNNEGQVIQKVIDDHINPVLTISYEYDNLGSLVSTTASDGTPESSWGEEQSTYVNTYDEKNNLIEQKGSSEIFYFRNTRFNSTQTFERDKNGNILKEELIITDVNSGEQVSKNIDEYTYDNKGNVTILNSKDDSGTSIIKYEYDEHNNKIKEEIEFTPNGQDPEYTTKEYTNEYDEFGNLIKITTKTISDNSPETITYMEQEYQKVEKSE